MRIKTLICLLLLLAPVSQSFGGDDLEQRLKTLEDASKTQSKTIEEQQRVIDEMKKGSDNGNLKPTGVTGLFGGSSLGNPNISLIVDTFFYSSNLNNVELESRGIPGFTSVGIERKNGFNLGAAELFIYAPVDPYLNLYATLPVTEAGAEVEEAYFITTALPKGFQIKGGKFKSGFGRINAGQKKGFSLHTCQVCLFTPSSASRPSRGKTSCSSGRMQSPEVTPSQPLRRHLLIQESIRLYCSARRS